MRRLFSTHIGPNAPRTFAFNANPILFNVRNERYVIQGKERLVGAWLGLVSASIFAIVIIGGHTRLTKSGLSMTRWEPHRLLPPMNSEEWDKEFEEYKKSPEYQLTNKDKGMDVTGFKYIFFWEWFHRIVGRSIGVIFFGPLCYFWYRGYLQSRLKKTLASMFVLGGLQGAIGWWMVKSGLTDKRQTTEVDKAPRVSPYRLTVHAGNAYLLYAVCLW
jgi:cytochrome c oxidase assembly protein subunit 15